MEIRMNREVVRALWALAAPKVELGHREFAAPGLAEECELDGPCPASELCDELRARADLMRGDARCPGFCQQAVRMLDAAIVAAARFR